MRVNWVVEVLPGDWAIACRVVSAGRLASVTGPISGPWAWVRLIVLADLDAAPGRVRLGSVHHDGPIPLDARRDLLALCRALFVTFKGMGKGYDKQLNQLAQIGSKLSRALEKAQKGGPGTWNHRTAWLMAEEATKELATVVDVYLPAKALITASGERLLKKR